MRFFIGWDVGGWNCDHNGKSRDAIVILDDRRMVVGEPWRGNLRTTINGSRTTADWIAALFRLCGATPAGGAHVTLAIDTPLGFSNEFLRLAAGLRPVTALGDSATNPYLFRRTERWLFESGLSPLSPVKDMIGSQATKGMHVLARFAPRRVRCGVWSGGAAMTAIEAYPSACKKSKTIHALCRGMPALRHRDLDDARICALVAFLFATDRPRLAAPVRGVPPREGWIWVPADAIPARRSAR
jgi:hypothetical protein